MSPLEALHRNLYILSHLLEQVIAAESLTCGSLNTLSKPQYETLLYVQNHPGARPSDLARASGTTAPTVTNLLQRLERKELLQKAPASDDQRSVVLSLTAKGEQLLRVVEEERRKMLIELVSRLPEQDQQSLGRGLEGLLRAATTLRDRSQLCLQCGNAHTEQCILAQCDQLG